MPSGRANRPADERLKSHAVDANPRSSSSPTGNFVRPQNPPVSSSSSPSMMSVPSIERMLARPWVSDVVRVVVVVFVVLVTVFFFDFAVLVLVVVFHFVVVLIGRTRPCAR